MTQEIYEVKVAVPVVASAAYADGDRLGAAGIEIDVGRKNQAVTLQSLSLVDDAKQSSKITLLFFSAPLAAGTDNAAADPTDAELETFLGSVVVAAADYTALNDNSAACVRNIGLGLKPASGSDKIYCLPVCGGTPTYANAADLSLRLYFKTEQPFAG